MLVKDKRKILKKERKTFENFNSGKIIKQLCAFMSITVILSLNKNLLNRVYTASVTNFKDFL